MLREADLPKPDFASKASFPAGASPDPCSITSADQRDGTVARNAHAFVLGAVLLWSTSAFSGSPPDQLDVLDGLSSFAEGQYAEALQSWRAAAAQGNATGALYAGVMYDTGQGVRQDDAQALYWYREGAALGSPTATFNVGVMYDAGIGVTPQPAEAARWYGHAAKLGYARADYNLALLYASGTGVHRNSQRAAALFRTAARLGLSAAGAHLAAMGEPASPPGVTQTDVAMRDFAAAQAAMLSRSPSRTADAAAMFRHAAEQGNPLAEYDLGYCYDNGIGVAADRVQAYLWYSRAAAAGHDPQVQSMAEAGRDSIKRRLTPAEQFAIRPGTLSAGSSHQAAPGK